MNVDTAKLRQFINEHFGPEDLRTFLFDYFRSVYDDLTDGLTKSRQISLLLEYCHKHKKFPDLLAAIQRERSFFQPDDYVQGKKVPTVDPQPPAPITRNPRQIFISHAHQDAEVAQRLAHDLEAHGYDIWIAPDSIRPGEKWVEAINRGLEESSIFILLLSPNAVASRWVKMETNVAISLTHEDEIQFYPLMLEECRLPALWRAFHYISIVDEYTRGMNQLLATISPNNFNFVAAEKDRLNDEEKVGDTSNLTSFSLMLSDPKEANEEPNPEVFPPVAMNSKSIVILSNNEYSSWSKHMIEVLGSLGNINLYTESGFEGKSSESADMDMILVDASSLQMELSKRVALLNDSFPKVPIMVFDSSPTWRQAREVLAAGATDYIRRSLDDTHLLERLGSLLYNLP